MASVDLGFRVIGGTLPIDHGYSLFSAVAAVLGSTIHDAKSVGICPIAGTPTGRGTLQLTPHSCLRIRTPADLIPAFLKLAGRSLDVGGQLIRLGVPQTHSLMPAANLRTSVVTIKGFCEPQPFLEAARRQLDALGVRGEATIPSRRNGLHTGEPMRRVLRIKDKTVVGFAMLVSALTAEESLTLQENGIGGRRHMGCGVFVPAKPEGISATVREEVVGEKLG